MSSVMSTEYTGYKQKTHTHIYGYSYSFIHSSNQMTHTEIQWCKFLESNFLLCIMLKYASLLTGWRDRPQRKGQRGPSCWESSPKDGEGQGHFLGSVIEIFNEGKSLDYLSPATNRSFLLPILIPLCWPCRWVIFPHGGIIQKYTE